MNLKDVYYKAIDSLQKTSITNPLKPTQKQQIRFQTPPPTQLRLQTSGTVQKMKDRPALDRSGSLWTEN